MLIDALTQFSHQPLLVYTLVVVFMFASSFGFPVPEEVVLLTLGFLAYMALHPESFPSKNTPVDPTSVWESVNVHIAAWVAFVAVLGSDFVVYLLGLKLGKRVLSSRWVSKVMNLERQEKVFRWTQKFGPWAAGVFRFTPGVRFPGHLTCGILRVPMRKFLLVDGFAALISVPTQVYLVGYYGKEIIDLIKKYQIWFLLAAVVFLMWAFRAQILGMLRKKQGTLPQE
jgi:membrane protein DedA with SNARE-associated domain